MNRQTLLLIGLLLPAPALAVVHVALHPMPTRPLSQLAPPTMRISINGPQPIVAASVTRATPPAADLAAAEPQPAASAFEEWCIEYGETLRRAE
jgi:hypothetical protein